MGFWAVPKHVHTRRAPSRVYTNTCIWMYECLAYITPGIVVFATHYGEDILDGGNHGMTLVEQTALTSRNITGGHVMNVLCSRATSNPNLNPSPSHNPNPNPEPDH